MSWNAWDGTDISTALFPVSCAYSDKTTWRLRWKIPLETPGNAISLTLLFKTSLDASVLKSLCLWRKFQSCLLFIINLLLKNFLTALDIVILLCVVFNLFWCNCMDQFKYTDCILVLGKILLVLCRKRNANVSNIGWWSVRPCGNYRCTKILTYPYTIINYFVLLPCGL